MKYEAGNTKQEIQSRKYKAENTKQKIQSTKYEAQNIKHKYKTQNMKHQISNKPVRIRETKAKGRAAAQKIVRMTFVQWRGDSFMRLIGMPCTME